MRNGPRIATGAARPRGRVRADLVYLGWRQVLAEPDPGPPPTAPKPPAPEEVSADWVAAQHREHGRLSRPARLTLAAGVAVTCLAGVTWLTGSAVGGALVPGALGLSGLAPASLIPAMLIPAMLIPAVLIPAVLIPGPLMPAALSGGLAALLALAGSCVAAAGGRRLWRARRLLAAQLRAEEQRVAAFRSVQRDQYAALLEEYASLHRDWQQRAAAFRRQPLWHPVTLPTSVHRVDVAGGTLAGWSALLTMIAAPRLESGGAVTVIDLTEGGVAADLLAVARQSGLNPLVWVLPADLAQLELGADFGPELLADVLAQTAGAAETGAGGANQARDAALLRRLLRALGDGATMAEVIAALRFLGQLGAPGEHLDSGALTRQQLSRLSTVAGQAAGHLLVDRAWALEARLQVLAPLATELTGRPSSRLKVAWLDRRASVLGNDVLAAYLAVALTALLRQAPRARRWQQTICLLGAERLPGDVLDRLCDTTEVAGAGLVLAYRAIPAHVRERLGRGDAAVGFMRLGNADEARLAAEQIGAEHRFVVSQFTDTIGASVTDTAGGSYTSSVGTSDSASDSSSVSLTAGHSRGRGQTRHGAFAPFAELTGSASRDVSESTGTSDSTSLTAGISASTSWGWTTSRAIGASDSLARTVQRSRESLVEPHELQQLPPSALLLWYPAPGGRQVVLADANPAIIALPTATLALR